MTHKEIFTILKTLGIPVAYDHFDSDKQIQPPFIVYREISPNTFKADCITYYRPYEFEIEVITEKKDVSLQNQIETLLTNNHIPYDMDNEVWDDDERIYHNYYEI